MKQTNNDKNKTERKQKTGTESGWWWGVEWESWVQVQNDLGLSYLFSVPSGSYAKIYGKSGAA